MLAASALSAPPATSPSSDKQSLSDRIVGEVLVAVHYLRNEDVQKRLRDVGLVIASVLFVAGPLTGPQSTFGALARRGLFSDKCHKGETPCVSQHQAIELSTDIIMSVCFTVRVFLGIAQDRLGAYAVVPLELFLWVVGTGISGFAPANGMVWSIGQAMAAIFSLGAFGAMCLVHLRDACPDVRDFNFWSVIINALWDTAVLLNFCIAAWLDWTAIPFWLSYSIMACVLGLPVATGFLMWMQREKASASLGGRRPRSPTDAEQADPVWLSQFAEQRRREERQYREDAAAGVEHREFRAELTSILASLDFWLFTANASVLTTTSYFFIANIGTIARAMYATTTEEAEEAHAASTIMMAAFGVTSFVPVRLLHRSGTRRGVGHVTLLSSGLLFFAAMLLILSRGRLATFIAYSCIFVWRVWSYSITVPFYSWRFGHCASALGVSNGLVFTVAGIVSLLVGPLASSTLHHDTEKNFTFVIVAISGIAVLTHGVFAYVLVADPSETPQPGAGSTDAMCASDGTELRNTGPHLQPSAAPVTLPAVAASVVVAPKSSTTTSLMVDPPPPPLFQPDEEHAPQLPVRPGVDGAAAANNELRRRPVVGQPAGGGEDLPGDESLMMDEAHPSPICTPALRAKGNEHIPPAGPLETLKV